MSPTTDRKMPEARTLNRAATKEPLAFTIATLVTDPVQYDDMRATFAAAGFTEPDCEFLFIDNTGAEQTEAYRGLNLALTEARGRYVILCHQDVRLIAGADDRAVLEARLMDLDAHDPAWAVAGNAGGTATGRLAMRISDPHGADRRLGNLPARVASLDENFIVVKRAANLAFSRDLSGFHLYGADLCTIADVLGWHAYVIDFHLRHLSPGNPDRSFKEARESFRAKWARALRPRWVQTTCTLLRIGADIGGRFAPFTERPLEKMARRLRGAGEWTGRGQRDNVT